MFDRNFQFNFNAEWIKKHLAKIVIGAVVLILVFSSVRTVGPEEEGVVVQLADITVPNPLALISSSLLASRKCTKYLCSGN